MKRNFLSGMGKVLSAIMALIFICLLHGCMYFYKVQKVNKVTPQEIRKYDSLNKYLILHQGTSAWYLPNPSVTDNMLSGTLSPLPAEHLKYRTTNSKRGNRYIRDKTPSEKVVLTEVHLYLQDSIIPDLFTGNYVQLAVSAIRNAEVYVPASGRTAVSWIIPAMTPFMIIGGIVIAVAATSCPFIYVKNDTGFVFTGEIFGGAVYSSLERHDYLPLPAIKPSGNRYTLKISNKLEEIQHINLAELWIVNHPENVMVLPDRNGSIQTFTNPGIPVEAYSSAKKDLLPLVSAKDQKCFLFDEEPSLTGDTNAFNSVVMTFAVPDQADTGKLVIKAGNSLWGDYTYGEFMKLFGNKYHSWIKKQRKVPAGKNIQWKLDQRFVMMVSLETEAGWQFVDYFDMIGPMGKREMIMPVALTHALFSRSPANDRTIRIRLESGFRFWELDYAAMDFSGRSTFTIDYAQPVSATTESGKDVTQLLLKNDNKYYIQNNTGEEGVVVYQDSPEIPGMKKSVILHAKGYYEHVRDYPDPPDKKQLVTFGIPGRLSQFSFTNYLEFIKAKAALVTDPVLP